MVNVLIIVFFSGRAIRLLVHRTYNQIKGRIQIYRGRVKFAKMHQQRMRKRKI